MTAAKLKENKKSWWWVWMLAGAGGCFLLFHPEIFTPIKNPIWNFLNSNFSTAFFGAIGGALTIMLIEWMRQQVRLLADINASIGVFGSLINNLLNIKRQFIVPLSEHYKTDTEKYQQIQILKAINPNPAQPVVVSYAPYLKRYFCPLLPVNAPLEKIFSQAHKKPGIVPIIIQAQIAVKEVENTCDVWNKMIEKMQGMPEDERGMFYFGQATSTGVTDTYYPDVVQCLTLYTDDALFFVNRSIEALMHLGKHVLPFWLRGRICKAIIIDEDHKSLMPSNNHLEGWHVE